MAVKCISFCSLVLFALLKLMLTQHMLGENILCKSKNAIKLFKMQFIICMISTVKGEVGNGRVCVRAKCQTNGPSGRIQLIPVSLA